jgi:hypothetical protein
MPLGVTVGALIAAIACIAQGVYVLRTGIMTFFFVRPSPLAVPKRRLARVTGGAFYIWCGLWILWALLHAPLRGSVNLRSLTQWMRMRWDSLLIAVSLGGAGILLLVRPAIGVAWARAANPEIPAQDWVAPLIVRIVAGMVLGFAVLILGSILRPG